MNDSIHDTRHGLGRRKLFAVVAAIAASGAAGAWLLLREGDGQAAPVAATEGAARLERPHSPVLGTSRAPVTIVEFFDPSCEGCRAWYPYVKRILADHPGKIRLVIRYAPFHEGSDEAVAILEAAREQGRYETVLEALLRRQPEWAIHGAPNLAIAWKAAEEAGLDTSPARRQPAFERASALLAQDVADTNGLLIERTPTFFVNGKPLERAHPDELRLEVERAIAASGGRPARP